MLRMLYVSMSKKEKWLGILCLVFCAVILPLVFRPWSSSLSVFLETCLGCAAVVLVFHRFLWESIHVPLTSPVQILAKALLGIGASVVLTVCMNDLFLYYTPEFFDFTDFGPMYHNVNKVAFAALVQENFLLTAPAFVVLMPVAEEVLFRGLLFGSILPRSRSLAWMVSVTLFALVPVVTLLGHYPPIYIALNFLQYVPLGLVMCWIYTSTETILTPIAARMIIHAFAICTMR